MGNEERNKSAAIKTKQAKGGQFYKSVWRWHLYAGVVFAPLLVLLAITGSVYLFKAEIENVLYADYYEVQAQEERVAISEQLSEVNRLYPEGIVTAYRPGENESRSSEVKVEADGMSMTVFIDPYTGLSLGELNNDDRIMDKIEEIHGELMAGTLGDRIVELAASWAVVLIVTGLFLWFPKKMNGAGGVLFPRLRQGPKIRRRDLHAVPAFWLSAGLLFLIMTGLPWSGFWGTNFQAMVTNTGEGYPPSVWVGDAPKSDVETQDIAEVPWAAETLDVPLSSVQGLVPLSLDKVVEIADQEGIHPAYSVFIPQEPEGVYTLSVFPPKAQDEATMHIDQYSGAVLADYRYDNYGVIGKVVAWGITLHKGSQFGLINQLISLFICLGIVFVAVSGVYLWWKRKPKKGMGAPKAPPLFQTKSFLLLMIVLGLLFPLAGLSMVIVWLFDKLVIQRLPAVKKWLNA
ncbi:PepSY domain-containing protein [Planococcus sp. CP5-4]|uniref:PepSY-associated TM helix domain-containing protein n=1 Tax=unclassified Planococcus (in: firmicutes) TaxID=2662419 RepID=UPI001C23EF77|nr:MULTISPECIES: PepSY domain-containing protein [unclassified Planococcus (in: firmicutes)]MBU9674456.1 PepSY domain-containing protein [Planococcus sp. CP5-4_YE]MBV0910087.1 PepSY domain-containing protein [Planococcus sp. CP5-4_UN]MBW6064705.1 PepSY domain-containing protein [Planococcus sp. CP5-4]